jgi:hypothetical protein
MAIGSVDECLRTVICALYETSKKYTSLRRKRHVACVMTGLAVCISECLVCRRCSDSVCDVVSLYLIDLQKLSPETGSPRREHYDEFLERRNRMVCYLPG